MDSVDRDKKKVRVYYSLLVSVICIIAVSYAFFTLYLRQSDNNTLASRTCFSTSFTEDSDKISLSNEYPVIDSTGMKKQAFSFTIKNNCSSYVKVYITIDSAHRGNYGTSYLDDNYIKYNLSPSGTKTSEYSLVGSNTLMDLDDGSKGYVIASTGLGANEEKSYDLRLWIDENVTLEQGLGKSWDGKIVVVSEASKPTFAAAILADNEVKTPLTTPGTEVSAYKESEVSTTYSASVSDEYQAYYVTYGTGWEANGTGFNLTGTAVTTDTYANSYASLVGKYLPYNSLYYSGTSTSGEAVTTTNLSAVYYVVSAAQDSFTYKRIYSNKNITEALLASAEDDYGTSYYFRGAVTNNYVQFANKCWRIVRIGGDNTVKLILHNDNTSNASNPCSAVNNEETAAFAHYSGSTYKSQFNTSYSDNAYVGFMYGTSGASTYEETHANTNKSTILTNLETWYNNNLKIYESVIDDNVFCSDKSKETDITFDPWNITPNGLGYAANKTYYGSMKRVVLTRDMPGGTGPNLKCNGSLSKITGKIGLITVDELMLAGYAFKLISNSVYLQENANNIWVTLTPSDFFGYYASIWSVDSSFATIDRDNVFAGGALRPLISIKASVKVSSGTGSTENPYILSAQ